MECLPVLSVGGQYLLLFQSVIRRGQELASLAEEEIYTFPRLC